MNPGSPGSSHLLLGLKRKGSLRSGAFLLGADTWGGGCLGWSSEGAWRQGSSSSEGAACLSACLPAQGWSFAIGPSEQSPLRQT